MTQALLDQLRAFALSLPETSEEDSWGHPNFLAGKRTFLVYEFYQERPCIAVKLDPVDGSALLSDPRFFQTPYIGKHGWISLWVDEPAAWAFVRELHLRPYSEPWRDWCVASNTLLRCLGADVLGQLGFNESHVRQRFRAYSDDSPRRSGLANVASCALIGLVLEPLILPINSPGHLGC